MRPWLISLCLVMVTSTIGCGPPASRPPEQAASKAASSPSLEMGGSEIRIADPRGEWEFEARSARVKAASAEGPYQLAPAEGEYRAQGRAAVQMRAARAQVNKQTGMIELRGAVRISSEGWTLDSERVSYDLKRGKVVASGRTKLTFGREAVGAPQTDRRQTRERGR